MVGNDIPKLDSEHEEQDDSASDSSDVHVDDMALLYVCLLLCKQWWVLLRS